MRAAVRPMAQHVGAEASFLGAMAGAAALPEDWGSQSTGVNYVAPVSGTTSYSGGAGGTLTINKVFNN